VTIPPFADSGSYRAVIAVKDELAGKETSKEVSFQVRGRDVEPSDRLVVRNFRFLRAEDDVQPLAAVAAYRPGDAVWARFEMTGYKIAEQNRFHVDYGLAVLGPSGKTLFSQPQAAVEQDRPLFA
jgi:hypothetical protein